MLRFVTDKLVPYIGLCNCCHNRIDWESTRHTRQRPNSSDARARRSTRPSASLEATRGSDARSRWWCARVDSFRFRSSSDVSRYLHHVSSRERWKCLREHGDARVARRRRRRERGRRFRSPEQQLHIGVDRHVGRHAKTRPFSMLRKRGLLRDVRFLEFFLRVGRRCCDDDVDVLRQRLCRDIERRRVSSSTTIATRERDGVRRGGRRRGRRPKLLHGRGGLSRRSSKIVALLVLEQHALQRAVRYAQPCQHAAWRTVPERGRRSGYSSHLFFLL